MYLISFYLFMMFIQNVEVYMMMYDCLCTCAGTSFTSMNFDLLRTLCLLCLQFKLKM